MPVRRTDPARPRPLASAALVAASLLLPASAARAQVGHEPERSPFQDLEWRGMVSLQGGGLSASAGPAGVAPRGGAFVGLQNDLHIGGPAWFTARLQSALSERTVIDPARDEGDREIGAQRRPLTFLDLGVSFALTGQKSYRGLVPLLHVGAGAVSDFASPDVGGFRVGTRLALAYGGGVRWVPQGRRVALRVDVGWRAYQISFPQAYLQQGLDGTSVFPNNARRTSWRNNLGFTLGASYQYRR